MTNLPENVTAIDHQGDIVLTGPTMTATVYSDIMTAMQPEERNRVIGWIRTGR